MRGQFPKSWLFTWLNGLRNGDSDYEVPPLIQPIVTADFDWPLEVRVFNGDFTAAAGTNIVNLPNSGSAPTNYSTGRHRVWLNLVVSTSGNGGNFFLYYEQDQLTARRVTLAQLSQSNVNVNRAIPLIGGYQGEPSAAVPAVLMQGNPLGPTYSRDPDRIVFAATAMVGGETLTLRGLYIELPYQVPLPFLT